MSNFKFLLSDPEMVAFAEVAMARRRSCTLTQRQVPSTAGEPWSLKVDQKSKLAIEQSLYKLETLKKSLMQEYFE